VPHFETIACAIALGGWGRLISASQQQHDEVQRTESVLTVSGGRCSSDTVHSTDRSGSGLCRDGHRPVAIGAVGVLGNRGSFDCIGK